VPLPKSAGQQAAFGGWPTGAVSFTVPGASEASRAYELTPVGIHPLSKSRVTGGIHVALDSTHETLVLLTQDQLVVTNLLKRIQKTSQRAADLKRLIAEHQLAAMESASAKSSGSRGEAEKPTDPLEAERKAGAASNSGRK